MLKALLAIRIAVAAGFQAPAAAQDDVATVRLDGRAVFQVGPTSDAESAGERALPEPDVRLLRPGWPEAWQEALAGSTCASPSATSA